MRLLERSRSICVVSGKRLDAPAEGKPGRVLRVRGARALDFRDRLFVIARNATLVYRGKAVAPRAVAKDLGIRYVLEGSVQKSSDRIRSRRS